MNTSSSILQEVKARSEQDTTLRSVVPYLDTKFALGEVDSETVEELLKDSKFRVYLSCCAHIPKELFYSLELYKSDEFARACLAFNPSLPYDLMLKLASDGSVLVRKGIAANPSASEEILQIIKNDRQPGYEHVLIQLEKVSSSNN